MKGWLVVNAFLESEKFKGIYSLLTDSAKLHNIELECYTTADLCGEITEGFEGYNLPDFVIYWDKDICLAQNIQLPPARHNYQLILLTTIK